MKRLLIGCLALGLATIGIGAEAQQSVGACRTQSSEPGAAIVCGVGSDALTIVPGTQSPDGKFAVAWRDGRKKSDRDWVDSYLVRLSDGTLLLPLAGKFEGSNGQLYNHEEVTAYWNLEGSALAVIVNQKWETRSLHIYFRRYDGKVVQLGDFFANIEKAFVSYLKRRRPKLARLGYTTTLRPGAVVRRGESVHLVALLQVPKSEEAPIIELRMKLDVSEEGVRLGRPYR